MPHSPAGELVPYTVVIRGHGTVEHVVYLPPGASYADIIDKAWDDTLTMDDYEIDFDPNDIEVIS